jgi:hypothetical protein
LALISHGRSLPAIRKHVISHRDFCAAGRHEPINRLEKAFGGSFVVALSRVAWLLGVNHGAPSGDAVALSG